MDHQVQLSHSVTMSQVLIDHMLTKQALAGDQDSFEVLMKKYEQPLRNYIRRVLKDYELIDDILQHVFLQFYLSLPKLRTNIPLRAWLYRVAYNRCLDELRRKYRRRAVSFSQLEREDAEEAYVPIEMLPDMHLTPEETFEQQELHEQLLHAMDVLSPRCRAVVYLRCFDELSYSEIGEKLNMPVSTAKTYFSRSLPQLRTALLAAV